MFTIILMESSICTSTLILIFFFNRSICTMSFNGNHKLYEKCDSYTFKQNEGLTWNLIVCNVKVNVSPSKSTSS